MTREYRNAPLRSHGYDRAPMVQRRDADVDAFAATTPLERIEDELRPLADLRTRAEEAHLPALTDASQANDRRGWLETRSQLDTALQSFDRTIDRAVRLAKEDPEALARIETARADRAAFASAIDTVGPRPSGVKPVSLEGEIVATLKQPLTDGYQLGSARKRAELGRLFSSLDVPESRALRARLTSPVEEDELATAFKRLLSEAKSELLGVLQGAPRRAALEAQYARMPTVETSSAVSEPAREEASAAENADAAAADAGTAAPGVEVPHRVQMERLFGQEFGGVEAHLGQADALSPMRAQAAARGEEVAFASNDPSPGLVAHELTHVVQQRQAGSTALAAKKQVSDEGDAAEVEADEIAEKAEEGDEGEGGPVTVEEEPSADVSLDRGNGDAGDKKSGGDKTGKDDESRDDDGENSKVHKDGRPAILNWAGNTPLRSVTTSSDADVYENKGDVLLTNEEWAFALQGDKEVGSTGIFAVNRKYAFNLEKSGVEAVVQVKTRAHVKADKAPNDIRQLIETSAVWVSHDAEIIILKPEEKAKVDPGAKHANGQSPAELLVGDPLIAFETTAKDRIWYLVDTYLGIRRKESNDHSIDKLSERSSLLVSRLVEHEKAKKNYEDGDPMSLVDAEELLADLIKKHEQLKSNYERAGSKDKEVKTQIDRLEKLYRKLYDQYLEAYNAKAPNKDWTDHAEDWAKAPFHAGIGFVGGLAELAKMLGDGARYAGDEALEEVGVDVGGWEAWSEVGKAYQSGKSTEEILETMWDGFFDRLDKAFEHGRNGDFSMLFDITAETGLDIGLGLATAGTGTAASWSAKAGKMANTIGDAAKAAAAMAKRLEKRARQALKDLKKLLKEGSLPKWGKDAIKSLQNFVDGMGDRFAMAGADGANFAEHVPDGPAAKAMMREAGLGRAADKAMASMRKRRIKGMTVSEKAHFVNRLEEIAKNFGGGNEIARVFKKLETVEKLGPYVQKIEELLGMASELGVDDLVACLKRSTQVRDGAAFLDDVAAFAKRDLSGPAKSTILQKAAAGKAPDLDWLRKLDITDERLEYLASNPATNWKSFMKVSEETSDMYPAALDERFPTTKDKNKAYGDAAVKIRGVAGELAVKEMDLDPLKITREQVDVREMGVDRDVSIDYGVSGPKGFGLLEVKGWSKRKWKQQLKAAKAAQGGDEAIQHLLVQLDAAAKTGKPVYLAVTDALDAATKKALTGFLAKNKHAAVELVYFSEDKLKGIAKELRNAMMLGAGIAIAIDNETEANDGEED